MLSGREVGFGEQDQGGELAIRMGNRARLVDNVAGKTPGPLEIERVQMKRCRGELEEQHPQARAVPFGHLPGGSDDSNHLTPSPEQEQGLRAAVLAEEVLVRIADFERRIRAFLRCRERAPIRAGQALEYFDAEGKLFYTGLVPSSPGDGNLSFFGVVFDDAQIGSVRITTGDTRPGKDDDREHDIVMMDDFIYGEPRALP